MAEPFFTIGHSTRTVDELAELLRASRVEVLIDVRSMPRSRTNPQFNADVLPDALTPWQIAYEHIAELGGLRGKQRAVDPSPNGLWRVKSFRNYADYAMGERFAAGLAQLRHRGRQRRCAIMCAEAVWWRCHRRIIADYLLAQGEEVFHIMGPGNITPAQLTTGAIARNCAVLYPPVAEPDAS